MNAPVQHQGLVAAQIIQLAEVLGLHNVDPQELKQTLIQTAFKSDKEISDAQMGALMIVASQYKLNPWTKEIYAFPDKNKGIIPVVGVDGWSRIINSNPNLNGIEFVFSPESVRPNKAKVDCPTWVDCIIYRKDRDRPTVVREYLDEVYREPMGDHLFEIIKQRYELRRNDYVFPGSNMTSDAKHIAGAQGLLRTIGEQTGIEISLHDLRRTFATICNNLDYGPYTIKRLLNHRSGAKNDVTGGYVQVSLKKLRLAMNDIEAVYQGKLNCFD